MQDIVVIDSLRKRGFQFSDIQESLRYEAPEHKPRVWDKPPKRLSIKKVKDVPVYGCKQEFIMLYRELFEETNEDLCSLDMSGTKRFCDKEVYVALQTLIRHSLCYVQEQAEACYELFKEICMAPCDTLTKGKVYDVLVNLKPSEYYAQQVLDALRVCLFGDDNVTLYWTNLADYCGFYKTAIDLGKGVIREKCVNEREVMKFLKENYSLAAKDLDFMHQVYKPGANKYVIAMLYYLKNEHPEALEPGTDKDGFAKS